ncbi:MULTISPECIES: PEP-CTERM sorting domain-containing protein [unclassified Lentimonas]|uniref:PEP-CTERM sorting domain-containing protein n=1 Tax=unclassified Lentimonas TaxID=2630993 RepID=UPI00132445E3|nr:MULTISPECIES: PEP-CTERM sorting domain-containing protein [unclassified Lentimonas]CAA6679258.1 Unannotated [Lentimonas sp. CC4]CAA6687413.1 Unannotated [Lentimonas sp. CC6]CAA7076068.1 Unannotated [Lentimonas sp. CC4]CAA7172131.1 Unannotated [Lentimonas sp. CC21]CAA7181118.1 Unannotated [Lentimonas sp. CC8]
MHTPLSKTLTLVAPFALAASLSHATLVSEESFSYTAGDLNGNGSAADAGWDGAWVDDQSTDVQVGASSLSFGSLSTAGGSISKSVNGQQSLTRATTFTPGANPDLWMSFLFSFDDAQGGQLAGTDMLHIGLANADNSGNDEAGLRIQSDGSNGLLAYLDNDGNLSAASFAMAEATTYLFVFNMNTAGNLSLTINPTNIGSTDLAPSGGTTIVSSEATAADNYNFFRIRTRKAANDWSADEIRFGSSYADVVPVPEPGTYALLAGMCAFSAVALRRRQS